MNEPTATSPTSPKPNGGDGLVNTLIEQVLGTIDQTDAWAATERVTNLRHRYPNATPAELAERLIRQRCLQAGTVGAVTSGVSIVPGLGAAATLLFGVAADLRMTYQLQSELVLELAAVYNRTLNLDDKRYIVALVTGLSAGANHLVARAGAAIAQRASQRLAQKALVKSLSFLGVAASSGINMVATYSIGRRAQAYFSQDPELLVTWGDHMRTLTGVDERKLADWLVETTERSWRFTQRQVQNAAGSVLVAGQAAGKITIAAAGQAGDAAGNAWEGVKASASVAGQAITALRTRRLRCQANVPATTDGESTQ